MSSRDTKTRGNKAQSRKNNTLLKVVLLGDGGVGKSCLMNRFVSDRFDSNSFHTIGVEFLNKDMEINGTVYTLQIWDTAGQERFKSLRTPFYRGSDICLLTFSLDDQQSFQNLRMWKDEFLYYADIKNPLDFPLVIVGNKVDVGDEERVVDPSQAAEWCRLNGGPPYVETSAKDATNVTEAFKVAVENWLLMEDKMEQPYLGDTVQLTDKSPAKVCCPF